MEFNLKRVGKVVAVSMVILSALLILVMVIALNNPDGQEDTSIQESSNFNIRVESQNVKFVDGKYRYFFGIHNYETSKKFVGSIKIELLKKDGNVIGEETFDARNPIGPGLGASVYFDIHTGPMPEFTSEDAVTGFRYEVVTESGAKTGGAGDIKVPETIERY